MRQEFEELNAVYSSAPIGLCVLDKNLRYIRVNTRLAEINGVPAAEHLGKTVTEVIPSPLAGTIESLARNVLKTGEPVYNREILGLQASGQEGQHCWNVHMFPIREETGQVRAVNVTVEDITDRKKMEKELRESEERFRAVFMSTMDAIVVTDPAGKGRVLSANPAACHMFGYTEKEFSVIDRETIIDMSDPTTTAMLEQREKTGEATATLRYKRKDGTSFLGEVTTVFFRNGGGHQRAVGVIRDVSVRKQTEEALAESRRRRLLALRAGRMATWFIDLRTGWGSFSEDAGPLYGMPRGWSPQNSDDWANHIHPDDRPRMLASVQAMIDSDATYREEFRAICPDGTIRWLETQGEVERNTDGEPLGSYGVVRDITDRKQTEAALRESDEQFRAMFESTNVGIAQADPFTGRLLRVNETCASMLGYTVVELTGMPFSEVTHPDDRQENWEGFSRLVRGEIDTYMVEKRFLCKNGDILWALVTANLVRDTSGRPIRTVAVINNISKRKLAEEAIRESEKEYRDLVETVNSIIIRWDRSGKILFLNEFGLQFFGYARDELIGQDIMTIVPRVEDGTGRDLESIIKDVFANPDKYAHGINQNVRKGGETCWVTWANRAIRNENGEVVELLAVGNDVTGLKKSQDELRQYREHLEELVRDRTLDLEEKNRKLAEEIRQRKKAEEEKNRMEAQLLRSQKIEALGSFAGGIAHDLNNILYPIIINTETLLEETDAGDGLHEMLEQTLQAAYRQRDLVKQILSFSRQDIQKLNPVHLAPLLEKTLDFIRSTLPSSIEIRLSVDAQQDTVLGDSTQIQQVIMNLCKNAADALESQQGIIEVSLTGVRMEGDPALPEIKPGEYVRLTIKDTGHGMSPDVMARIFDPFYTTKAVGKGSGMGLSVVHGILKKHGGSVTVESEEGKGSRFSVYLPLMRQKPVSSAADGVGKRKSREKILLVDDEEIILSSLERAMHRLGYDVTAERNPSEAYELFQRDPDEFDLVITDLTMPQMTGIALGRKLMDIRHDLPVILCTGYNDVLDEGQAKKLGFRQLLMKPAVTSDLKSAIRQAMAG